MKQRFKSLNKLSKSFVISSLILGLLYVIVFFKNVFEALAMDKTSYNCTEDSMMMQVCHDPFGSSLSWSVLETIAVGFPLVMIWLILGLIVFVRARIDKRRRLKYHNIHASSENKG